MYTYTTNILLCLKRNVSQIFKSSSSKKVFFKCVYHWYNLLRRLCFIPCDNWKTLLFIQTYHYPEVWYNRHVAAFFETSVWKKFAICIRYLLKNNVLNKIYSLTAFFTIPVCEYFTFYFINGILSQKLKSSLEVCFFIKSCLYSNGCDAYLFLEISESKIR